MSGSDFVFFFLSFPFFSSLLFSFLSFGRADPHFGRRALLWSLWNFRTLVDYGAQIEQMAVTKSLSGFLFLRTALCEKG